MNNLFKYFQGLLSKFKKEDMQVLQKLQQLEADNKKLTDDFNALMNDIHMVAYDEMNDEGSFVCCICSKGWIPADCDIAKSNCDFKWNGKNKGVSNE